jgi:hypothetical protein
MIPNNSSCEIIDEFILNGKWIMMDDFNQLWMKVDNGCWISSIMDVKWTFINEFLLDDNWMVMIKHHPLWFKIVHSWIGLWIKYIHEFWRSSWWMNFICEQQTKLQTILYIIIKWFSCL